MATRPTDPTSTDAVAIVTGGSPRHRGAARVPGPMATQTGGLYNGYWFWGRPSVVDLWHDLRAVTREIRPDWDLSAPGLRDAWDAGDLSPFHGWNKRAAASPGAA